MPRLVLVDDHAVFRDVVRFLFEKRYPDLVVVGEAAEVPAAISIIDEQNPDVVVLDMALRDGSGVDVARELLRRDPHRRILMLSMTVDRRRVSEALDAGALGYATKDEPVESLAEAVRSVAAGHRYVSPVVTAAGKDPLAALTTREREVFELAVGGYSSEAIAQRLSISVRTVETHRSNLLHKLGLRTPLDMVRFAARIGALPV